MLIVCCFRFFHSTNENSQSHKPFIEHRNNIPLKTFFSSPPVAVKLRWNSQMNNYKFFWSASLSLSSFALAVTVHSRYKISYFHFVFSDFSFNVENFSFTSNSINENSQSHKPFRTHKSFKKTNHFLFSIKIFHIQYVKISCHFHPFFWSWEREKKGNNKFIEISIP